MLLLASRAIMLNLLRTSVTRPLPSLSMKNGGSRSKHSKSCRAVKRVSSKSVNSSPPGRVANCPLSLHASTASMCCERTDFLGERTACCLKSCFRSDEAENVNVRLPPFCGIEFGRRGALVLILFGDVSAVQGYTLQQASLSLFGPTQCLWKVRSLAHCICWNAKEQRLGAAVPGGVCSSLLARSPAQPRIGRPSCSTF